jgi:hypothetical protein
MTLRDHPDILAAADEGRARAAAMVEAGGYTEADQRADKAFLVGANYGRSVALNEAADALEGGLGVEGTPRDLYEFRLWLRARAAANPVDPNPITTAVATIDALDASDPGAHGALDDVLLEFAPREVRLAAIRLIARCDWWAGA